jgi:hypothetical protein
MTDPIRILPWPTKFDEVMPERMKLIRSFVAQLLGSDVVVPTLDEFIQASYQAYLHEKYDLGRPELNQEVNKADHPWLKDLTEETFREGHRRMYEFMYPAAKVN